jgi:hypothetical protein
VAITVFTWRFDAAATLQGFNLPLFGCQADVHSANIHADKRVEITDVALAVLM